MVDKKLDYWESIIEELKSLKSKKEERVIKFDIILAKESENKEKEHNLMEKIIKEAKANENLLLIEEYASEVIGKGCTRYEQIEKIRIHTVKEIHAIDFLEKEIKRRIILSTVSFSNEEEITDKGKKKKWWGGKNE